MRPHWWGLLGEVCGFGQLSTNSPPAGYRADEELKFTPSGALSFVSELRNLIDLAALGRLLDLFSTG